VHTLPDEAIFVGDSLTGITASHRAGVRVIGCADEPSQLRPLSAAGADAVVTTLADVVAVLAR
jgi:beta-phosphoglucomutase-like phosphatase (HAD superfamily)